MPANVETVTEYKLTLETEVRATDTRYTTERARNNRRLKQKKQSDNCHFERYVNNLTNRYSLMICLCD